MMSIRTFLYKPSWLDWAAMLLFLLGTMASFWIRQPILGILLVAILVRAIDRTLHTIYTLTDTELIIKAGRITKNVAVSFENIERYDVQTLAMGAGRVIIIELKNGRTKSIVPNNIDACVQILQKNIPSKTQHPTNINQE